VAQATVQRPQGDERLTPQVRKALLALIVGGIAAILDSTMVTLALHTLVVRLHSTDGTIQWVTTGYLLAMAVAIPVTGWAESRWGGKRVWMAALVLFVAGSVLCALSWSAASLIGFRVLQGFAAGLIFPLMQTLGVRAAGGRASPNLIATVSLPLALGPILGPVVGGVILNWLSWRWLFLVNVPVIAVGLVLAWRLLPSDRPDPGAGRARLDVIGLALLAPALAGILLGLAVGKLVARFGARLVTIASFLTAAVATVPFAFAGPHTGLWPLGAVLVIRGFGIGAVLVPPMSVAYQDVPLAGIPHATMNTRIAQQVGASFGIAIVAVALQSLLTHGATSAFQGAFWWAIGITLAALIPALGLPAARAAGRR
jgi:MFS family permease